MRIKDEKAMLAFGRKLAGAVGPGDVVTLSGPLSAGKTTLVRGLLAALERKDDAAPPERKSKASKAPQLSLFGERSAESRSQVELVETLRALDLDRLTGLEALSLLQRLKAKL